MPSATTVSQLERLIAASKCALKEIATIIARAPSSPSLLKERSPLPVLRGDVYVDLMNTHNDIRVGRYARPDNIIDIAEKRASSAGGREYFGC